MKTLNCTFKAMVFFFAAFLFSASAGAQIVLGTGAIDANIAIDTGDNDPGIFDTIALGENITLNGCFSTFNIGGASSGPSLCYDDGSFGTTSGSQFDWQLVNDTTSASTSFTGRSVPLTTGGVSDFINAVGSYTLTLVVSSPFGEFVPLSPFGHAGVQPGGGFGTETASFTVTSAASVPEPSAILLLLPALALIGRRQKHKFAAQVT